MSVLEDGYIYISGMDDDLRMGFRRVLSQDLLMVFHDGGWLMDDGNFGSQTAK